MAKFVTAKLFLTLIFAAFVALMITLAPLHIQDVHAAARTSAVTNHPNSSTTCDWRNYPLSSTLELVDNSTGNVFDYEASNLNGQSTVKIWHNGYYIDEYYLPQYDDNSQIYIYAGTYGGEYVNACID